MAKIKLVYWTYDAFVGNRQYWPEHHFYAILKDQEVIFDHNLFLKLLASETHAPAAYTERIANEIMNHTKNYSLYESSDQMPGSHSWYRRWYVIDLDQAAPPNAFCEIILEKAKLMELADE